MKLRLGLLFIILIIQCTSAAILMRENVIFQQLDVVSTTNSDWKITFVSDISSFQGLTDKLYKAQDEVRYHLMALLKRYDIPVNRGIYHAFEGQTKELDALRIMLDELQDTYNDIRTLQQPSQKRRSKRSLLPIVGKALSFLFGTVSEDDLHSINSNINKLANNQKKISHVVSQSLTILNDTRVQVIQNRQTLNNVIISISDLGQKLQNLTVKLEQSVLELTFATTTLVQVNNYLEELKRAIILAKFYIEQLKLKFSILSLGHMSPTVISPRELQKLLLKASAHSL